MFSIRHFAIATLAGAALTFAIPGCEPERPDIVPSSAQKMDSGNGMVFYTAPHDGMVYIYDKAAARLVWSGHVTKGQAVDLDPVKNQIRVGDNIVANKILVGNHQHEIYFERSSAPEPVTPPAPPPATVVPSYNNGVTVTPNATVQPSNNPNGAVTVQPGLSVSPSPQPTPPTPPAPQQ